MAFEKQSITWKDFYGGFSQDDYLTTGKQVLYAENIDLTSSSDYIQLGKNSEGRQTTTDYVNGFIHSESGTDRDVFAYTDDGKIYDTEDGTVESSAIGAAIYTAFRFNGYLYFVSNHGSAPFSRITDANAHGNTNWGALSVNFTLTGDSISSSGGDIFPVITYLDEYFYIGIGPKVYQVTDGDVVEEFAIFDDDVVGLTRVGGVIKVYTKRGTIAFWDGESTSVDSVLQLNEPVRGVISSGKIDYIVAGHTDFQAKIKILNGYTVQELSNARYSEALGDYIGKIKITEPNQLMKLGETIYFIQDGLVGDDVYRFGTNNPVLKAGFNISSTQDSNGNNMSLRSLYGIEFTTVDRIRLGMTSNSQEAFEYIDINTTSPVYKDEGYLILNPFDGGSKTIQKKIEYIMLSTSNCDASETVELQYSIDGAAFSTIQTINSGTSLTRTEIYDHLDNFYDIKFKIIMSSSGGSDSPKLHELRLVYSLIEDDG